MRYYISDLHFFHKNLLHRMDNRGFDSVEKMHEYMIKQWNNKVRKNDEVVILGDFSFGKAAETEGILKQLNGTKYLCRGNHDKYLKDASFDKSLFKWIRDYTELNDNNRKVVLCHYPVFCYPGQYRVNEDGSPKVYMLFGHVHNTHDAKLIDQFQEITKHTKVMSRGVAEPVAIPCNMINCFCMYADYIPLTLDEWIECDRKRKENELRTD